MFIAPYPPYDPTDPKGFSFETTVKRWPVILTNIIDHVHRVDHDLQVGPAATSPEVEERIAQGKEIIERIGVLKYEIARDKPLKEFVDDGEPNYDIYNRELEELKKAGKDTWFKAPWLYAECHLFRLVRSFFAQKSSWKDHDPHFSSKIEVFRGSASAIYQLATSMHEIESEKDVIAVDLDKLSVLFKQMIQMCLWGNATDLALLSHLTKDDFSRLQTVDKDTQQSRSKFILRDDQDKVWAHVKTLNNAKLDIVLDNAGFELFTDFVFADFLVTYTPFIGKVVFHPKLIPWFVSDVVPVDFSRTIEYLLDANSFFPSVTPSSSSVDHLKHMVTRWSTYISDGTFSLSVPATTPLGGLGEGGASRLANFWTSPFPYWDMQSRDEGLWKQLSESGLVLFKGDLNYRKLTGDVKWPPSTPFETAIGPLAGSFPILSLRTNKADVVVGIEQSTADELDAKDAKWRISGRYALISFSPKSTPLLE